MFKNFQDFILNCNSKQESRDYWDFLIANKPDKSYFESEPDWGNLSIEKQAYYCAVIQKLFKDIAPSWIYKDKYYLKEPYFTFKTNNALRLILMIESPFEFKSRNIFISNNGLDRV